MKQTRRSGKKGRIGEIKNEKAVCVLIKIEKSAHRALSRELVSHD